MGTRIKRKVRIKKKNFAIFVLFIMVFAFVIYQIGFITYKLITTTKDNPKTEEKVKKKPKTKKNLSEYEKKLEKLNNVDKKVDYFKKENIDRYVKYKEKNNLEDDIQVIKGVNMNLDLTPYEDKIKAINLDSEIALVNKYYYVDENYVPKNLKTISKRYALGGMQMVDYAADAFVEMARAAEDENLTITALSTYRSYDYQIDLYKRYERNDGREKADTYSGRAGHSEHQTGLAVDIYDSEKDYTNFERTNEYKWMLDNAHKYGFILRFPKDKEKETGYQFESWHYRYVGKKIAKYIKENNISFEEYIATKK